MTWSDIANPRFLTILFGAMAPRRPSASMEARRRLWLDELAHGGAADFEDTQPCRWLLTEPPALNAEEAREHADHLR
jgi:hypothetical protein